VTLGRLLLRNLIYHWRGNSAVFLGMAVGTAVLTGALLVGDSLRGSLHERAERQLGWVDNALVAGRFFREELTAELAAERPGDYVCPAVLLRGAATMKHGTATRHVGHVTILGVDERFWPDGAQPAGMAFDGGAAKPVVLNTTLASQLGVAVGDLIVLHLQTASDVPRETLLGRKESSDVLDRITLTVADVLAADSPTDRFNLHPSPEEPRNAFVPLRLLQNRLNQLGPGSGRNPKPKLHMLHPVNALLVRGDTAAGLQEHLAHYQTLDDWGLTLRGPEERAGAFFDSLDVNHDGKLTATEWPRLKDKAFAQAIGGSRGVVDRAALADYYRRKHPYVSLESRQLFLEDAIGDAARQAADAAGLRAAPTLVYLADSLQSGDQEMAYAVIAAVDPKMAAPNGRFTPPGIDGLGDDDILLTEWQGSPLPPISGIREIHLRYYGPEGTDKLQKPGNPLRVSGWLPLKDDADDPDLTPEFPGITDQTSLANWDPPPALHYDNRRVKPADEDYWKEYRATPKAYVSLALGQRLWGSRFGRLTSLRLAPSDGGLSEATERVRAGLLERLRPEQGGLVFEAVRTRALEASGGGTDFGGLFLGFSLFLIVAALLLVGLLFRLNLDRRGTEIGLLLAAGFRQGTVRRLLLAEGSLLAVGGGLAGLAGAVAYAAGLLALLRAWWPGALEQTFLSLHVTTESFLIGFGAAWLVSVLTIWWALRVLGRTSPRALLAGETSETGLPATPGRAPRWSGWIASAAGASGLALLGLGMFVRDQEMRAMTFFGGGLLLLFAGLALVWAWMRTARHGRVGGAGGSALARLGVRNAARHPVRSLLTVGLLAFAAFLVVAVQSFHRDPDPDFLDPKSGSGGFALLGETDLPLYQDLNSARARTDLDFPASGDETLRDVRIFSLRLQAGDDASCLNLYQANRPRLLGVPDAFIERGGFRFQDCEAQTPQERANPWQLLRPTKGRDAIPVIGDAATVQWILKSKLGGELRIPDERGEMVPLRIVGLLADSIFQSQLLMSEADFLNLYPHHEGYDFFLIDAPPLAVGPVRDLLESTLAERGFETTPTAQRLGAYLAVENTYLATFQMLGGLGMVLGALGLAVVLVRTVWERRGELALLRALGFRRIALGWLIFVENAFLLMLGLGVGTVTAMLAVAPHLATGAGAVPWLRLAVFLSVVLAVGLIAGAVAMATSLRAPLLPALRRE
jgi:ABC-type antimicrobial peptide transport system permease subunit